MQSITQPVKHPISHNIGEANIEQDLSDIADWLREGDEASSLPDAQSYFFSPPIPCPRCGKPLGALDSTAFVVDTCGDTLSVHGSCIEDSDDMLEYFSYGEKVIAMQADWSYDADEVACYE